MNPLADDDPRHGTINGYNNLKCRCDLCRDANTKSHAAYMKRIRRDGRVLGTHGSSLSYDTGCRCHTCKEAHNKKSREFKQRQRGLIRSDDEDKPA